MIQEKNISLCALQFQTVGWLSVTILPFATKNDK